MELIVITTLWVGLSVLLTPCSASQQTQLQSSHNQAQDFQVSALSLPRKLKVIEEAEAVKVDGGKDIPSNNRLNGSLSGKQHHKEAGKVEARGGPRQDWVEKGTGEESQFFSMDYTPVRRRRPIHNKVVPVGRP